MRKKWLESGLKTSFYGHFLCIFKALAHKIRAEAATFYIAYSKSNWQPQAGTKSQPGVFQLQLSSMHLGHQAAQAQAQPYAASVALAIGIQSENAWPSCCNWSAELLTLTITWQVRLSSPGKWRPLAGL